MNFKSPTHMIGCSGTSLISLLWVVIIIVSHKWLKSLLVQLSQVIKEKKYIYLINTYYILYNCPPFHTLSFSNIVGKASLNFLLCLSYIYELLNLHLCLMETMPATWIHLAASKGKWTLQLGLTSLLFMPWGVAHVFSWTLFIHLISAIW